MNIRHFIFLFIISFQFVFTQNDTTSNYNINEVVVTGARMEETPVGPYNQPEWTTHRRFPSTRVFVQTLPGEADFEQWLEIRIPAKSSENTEVRLRQEFAFGLGERMQLDIYSNTEHNGRCLFVM